MNNVNINNEQQSTTGNIKNETTTPQVELLFRKRFMVVTSGFYWDRQGLYAPSEGSGILPYFNDNSDYSTGCRSDYECATGYICDLVSRTCFRDPDASPATGEEGGAGGVGYVSNMACNKMNIDWGIVANGEVGDNNLGAIETTTAWSNILTATDLDWNFLPGLMVGIIGGVVGHGIGGTLGSAVSSGSGVMGGAMVVQLDQWSMSSSSNPDVIRGLRGLECGL